jgi:hypothetical protein
MLPVVWKRRSDSKQVVFSACSSILDEIRLKLPRWQDPQEATKWSCLAATFNGRDKGQRPCGKRWSRGS